MPLYAWLFYWNKIGKLFRKVCFKYFMGMNEQEFIQIYLRIRGDHFMTKVKVYQQLNRIPYKYIPIMIITSLSINILNLALPLTMKQIYSRVVANNSYETLILLIAACFIALVLEVTLRKIKDSSEKWIASKYEYQLSNFLVSKILTSFTNEFREINYHANLDKFNSVSRVTAMWTHGVYQLLIDLPFACLFLYVIYALGGKLFFVPLLLSIAYIIMMYFNAQKYFNYKQSEVNANNRLMSHLIESLEKIHLIKASGMENFQISKYKKALNETIQCRYQSNQYEMFPETIASNMSQLTLFSILIAGGYLLLQGSATYGEITACALLGGRAVGPVQSIMNLYMQYKDIRLMKNQINTIATLPECYESSTPMFPEDITGTIEIMNLPCQENQLKSVENLNVHIPPGSFIHINPVQFMSYKQLFKRLSGREHFESGKILIDNLDITEWNLTGLKGKIEYLTDTVNLFKGSVLQNITYFNPSKVSEAYEAATLTGLDEMVAQLVEGFETPLDSQSVNSLSSAFLQRLNITRVLLERPRILLIDCIDGSMDIETHRLFVWLLTKFKGKMTILIATENEEIKALSNGTLGLQNAKGGGQ